MTAVRPIAIEILAALGLGACCWLATPDVRASSGLDSPEVGIAQVGRGGAWLARADDPLAVYFNPAAMVRNPSGAHLGAHVLIESRCFERRDVNGQPVSPGSNLRAAPGEVCADIPPLPNPQLGVTYHFLRRFAVGLGMVGPHANVTKTWPDVIEYENAYGVTDADHPSPQRYLLLDQHAILVFPTVSASFAILRNLSVGAGFTWGVASLSFSNMAEATSAVRGTPQPDDFTQDIKANVDGLDGFIPGFVVGALYSPIRQLDVAAWYRFSDRISTKLHLYAQSNYYTGGGAVDETAINDPKNITDLEDAGRFELAIPMEARIGLRYHHPRRAIRSQSWVTKHQGWARDPLSEDLFDVEVDATWAHDSAVDKITLAMKKGIRINGTPGFVPENADVPHHWRDVVGVRLGGEYVVVPDLLALRAGGFFESKGVDDRYLNINFVLAERGGVGGGVSVRLSQFDVSAAYQHTFYGKLDNGGQGAVKTLSGDATTGDYRTRQTVNGGRIAAHLNEVALGLTFHF